VKGEYASSDRYVYFFIHKIIVRMCVGRRKRIKIWTESKTYIYIYIGADCGRKRRNCFIGLLGTGGGYVYESNGRH